MRRRHPQPGPPTRVSAWRWRAPLLALGLVALLLPGCAWLDHQLHRNEVGLHAISLHHFGERATDVSNRTMQVTDAGGTQRVCICRAPILSNRQIVAGELEPTGNPERPALRLRLDREGAILWQQACQEAPGDRIAVLLDGFFWHAMKLPRPVDTHSILINAPIGRAEAQAIVDAIPGHYRRLNPGTSLF